MVDRRMSPCRRHSRRVDSRAANCTPVVRPVRPMRSICNLGLLGRMHPRSTCSGRVPWTGIPPAPVPLHRLRRRATIRRRRGQPRNARRWDGVDRAKGSAWQRNQRPPRAVGMSSCIRTRAGHRSRNPRHRGKFHPHTSRFHRIERFG